MNFSKHPEPKSRLIGLLCVIGIHAVLIYALSIGLRRDEPAEPPPPIETQIIEEIKPAPEPPPPPPPEFTPPPPPSLPPPILNIAPPPKIKRETVTVPIQEEPKEPPPPPPPPRRQPVRVPPKLDLERSPRACRQPAYPSVSQRLGEEGTASVSLLISADGKKVLDSKILDSSSHKRLDVATIKAFSRCRFKPGTVDGKPEATWFSVRYKWVIPQ